jgi:hypothetical protein
MDGHIKEFKKHLIIFSSISFINMTQFSFNTQYRGANTRALFGLYNFIPKFLCYFPITINKKPSMDRADPPIKRPQESLNYVIVNHIKYRRRDSNPHDLSQLILSQPRLPFRHFGLRYFCSLHQYCFGKRPLHFSGRAHQKR